MSHTIRRRRSHNAHARGVPHGVRKAEDRIHRYRKRDAQRAVDAERPKPEPAVQVTDHALVRWLHRVCDVDVRGKIEAEMLADGRAELIHQIGSGRIRINGSRTTLIIRNRAVVSVVVDGAPDDP